MQKTFMYGTMESPIGPVRKDKKMNQKPETVVNSTTITVSSPIELLTGEHLRTVALDIEGVRESVNRLSVQGQALMLQVAYRLYETKANGWYKEDGFKSANEFAVKVFGYKSNMVSKMINAGKRITCSIDDNGVKSYGTVFGSFGLTQLFELSTLDNDSVHALIGEGSITPDMSCASIREVVKSYKASLKSATTNEGDKSDKGLSDKPVSDGSDASDASVSSHNTPVSSNLVSKRVNAKDDKTVNINVVKRLNNEDMTRLLEALVTEASKRKTFVWSDTLIKKFGVIVAKNDKSDNTDKAVKSI